MKESCYPCKSLSHYFGTLSTFGMKEYLSEFKAWSGDFGTLSTFGMEVYFLREYDDWIKRKRNE